MRFFPITKEWSYVFGFLHHNTCPKIDEIDVKGSYTLPRAGKCELCGEPIPKQMIMIAQLQDVGEGVDEDSLIWRFPPRIDETPEMVRDRERRFQYLERYAVTDAIAFRQYVRSTNDYHS